MQTSRIKALCLSLIAVATIAASAKSTIPVLQSIDNFSISLPSNGHKWRSEIRKPLKKRVLSHRAPVSAPDYQIGPVSSSGTLNSPDGKEWVYTAEYTTGSSGYTSAHFTIYDEKGNVKGTITDGFDLAEHETGVNYVEINPNVTQKFFNFNDKYEVIVFVHVTTDDYMGNYYQHVFSIEPDQTEPLMRIEGNQVLIADVSPDQWAIRQQMVMMRESFDDDNYYIHYDIYRHADWSSQNAPVKLHTFTINYQNLSAAGEAAFPLTVQTVGTTAYYALSYYEKPYFDPDIPVTEDPVVTPDNNFKIDIYSSDSFNMALGQDIAPVKTITIPIEKEPGEYPYSFPMVGGLMGNDDFSIGVYDNTTNPYFIVTFENYLPSSDDFINNIYLYDHTGKRVKTIITDADNYRLINDIPGHNPQGCFMTDQAQTFTFVDLVDCTVQAQIPYTFQDKLLSASIDRVAHADSYLYVISSSQGYADAAGNIFHSIAYFNPDGTLNHWDDINLGKDVVMAQVCIAGDWLNPYIFDTNPERDYMFLVKLPKAANPDQTEERLWVLTASSKMLIDLGPAPELGGELAMIAVLNPGSDTKLLCAYRDWQIDMVTLNFFNLPLNKFQAGGDGSAESPYIISTPGDLLAIKDAPGAYYRLAADIDLMGLPCSAICAEFTGDLDGQGHVVSGLALNGPGLFDTLIGTAGIHDLVIDSPVITPQGPTAGIIAGSAIYDGSNTPIIERVHIISPSVASDSFDQTFGGIIGQLSTGSTVSQCSLTDAQITLPRATVGGIVGTIPASKGIVSASVFTGVISAAIAGGIGGELTSAALTDCRVQAHITGSVATGGIVGALSAYSGQRGTITRCLFQGSLTSIADSDPAVGGIVGSLEEGDNLCISSCVADLTAIDITASATHPTAHRIVGSSCGDRLGAILWDDPWWDTADDPYSHPDQWPRAQAEPDAGLADNHACGIDPINGNAAMAADATSVEGKSFDADDLTPAFLATLGFAFGSDIAAPWALDPQGQIILYFEAEISGIDSPVAPSQALIRFDGSTITAQGPIAVYTLSGISVAQGHDAISTLSLSPGIYIAVAESGTLKFIIK